MNTLTFSRGQVVFMKGDLSDMMYEIVDGGVRICAGYGTADEQQIAEFGKGQIFGEMGMIEARPRSAAAVVTEENTILRLITEAEFNEYFESRPEKLLQIMRQLSSRIHETDRKYIDACRAVYEKTENQDSDWLRNQWRALYEDYADLLVP